MSDKKDLAKVFGVEHLVTKKTLVNETKKDVEAKTPNDAAYDIRSLLDEITVRVASKDIIGCINCLNAIQLRVDYMKSVAEDIRRIQGK